MRARRRQPRAGSRGDAGAALVEAAFVLPVMLVIAFGLISLGLAHKTGSVLTSASRTGARIAASSYAPAASNPATRAAMLDNLRISVERNLDGLPGGAEPVSLWIYEANAAGQPTGGAGCSSNCIRYAWNTATEAFGPPAGSWPNPRACGNDVDVVGVRIEARHVIGNPLLDRLDITRRTVMRLEPTSDAACT